MAKHTAHLLSVGEVMGSIPGPKRVIDKDVKGCTYLLLCQIHDISSLSRGEWFGPKQNQIIAMHS